MATQKKQGYCAYCRRWVLGEKYIGVGDGWGCVLTILTSGLFLPIWLLLFILNARNKPVCQTCGHALMKDEF